MTTPSVAAPPPISAGDGEGDDTLDSVEQFAAADREHVLG
jgi:hypothetical protein